MKAAAWVVGLAVLVGMGALLASSGCEKQQSAAPAQKIEKKVGGPFAGSKTYAELTALVADDQKKYDAAAATMQLPNNAKLPPPPYKAVVGATLEDKGTVLSASQVAGRMHALIDVDSDGKQDVDLDLAGQAAPPAGSKATFTATVTDVTWADGKLGISAEATAFQAK